MKTFACPICGCDYGIIETDDEDLSTGDKIEIITAFLNTASIEDVNSVYDGLFECDGEEVDGGFGFNILANLTKNTPIGECFEWHNDKFLVMVGPCGYCTFNSDSPCEAAVCNETERFDKKSVIFRRQ